jgi:phosphoribosylaminoimidazolecarboxamide formyltransferase/IMP cyclohydrolase
MVRDIKNMYREIQKDPFPETMSLRMGDQELSFRKKTWEVQGEEKGLRYGENPDQPAALFELTEGRVELGGIVFQGPGLDLVSAMREEHMIQAGKHPGKINLTDVDNGINILQYLHAKPAAVILKHNNPSGAAWSDEGMADALDKAYFADRIAAFGGALVINRPMDIKCAEFVNKFYLEVVAAPEFEPGVVDVLKKKKNLRIIKLPGLARLSELTAKPFLDIKSLNDGGMIVQFSFKNRILEGKDFLPAQADKDGDSVTARYPDKRELEDLLFAWAVEAGVTSNSVLFAQNGRTVAIGTGEQDRVGCVQLAVSKAYTKYADNLAFERKGLSLYQLQEKAETDAQAADDLQKIMEKTREMKAGIPGSVMVSDGFFPFRDGVDMALKEGVTAIAQPGGSIRDFEVIQAVNESSPQAAMVFTGQRSFKH